MTIEADSFTKQQIKIIAFSVILIFISIGVTWQSGAIEYRLGLRCLHGHGGLISPIDAIGYFAAAGKKEHKEAMYELGIIYSLDHHIRPNPEETAKYYAGAAHIGHSRSLEILSQKAEQGEPNAQYRLAELLYFKYEEYDRALSLYKKATRQGHLEARDWVETLEE